MTNEIEGPYTAPGNWAARPPQLLGVQYLRAVAALMVAYFHTATQIPQYRDTFRSSLLGQLNFAAGVDIFFVISGFIMLVSNRNSRPGRFAIKRIIRIVPLYWILTFALTAIAVGRPDLLRTTALTGEFFIKSLLFIPYLNPGHPGEFFPMLVPGWSLNFEMFFYVIFALVLLAPARLRVTIVGLVFVCIYGAGRAIGIADLAPDAAFYVDPRIFEFWLGMWIAHLFLAGTIRISRGAAVTVMVAGFAILITATLQAPWAEPALQVFAGNVVPAAAVIWGAIALERSGAIRMVPLLHWLGDASYSLYLSHIFSLGVARVVWFRLGLAQDGIAHAAAFACFGMIWIILGTWVVYTFIEQPVLRWLHGRFASS